VANEFRWAQRRFVTEAKYRKLARYTVKPGDVLITLMGTCGRCAVVPDDIPVAINTKQLCCITVDREKCLPEFLHSYFLLHPIARRYLRQTAKGAIMEGLNMGIIKEMPIPLVPIELQERYRGILENLSRVKTAARRSAAELDALFASLQHRAFRGGL
ncbi:MAG TPA: restriction endonuclease subunit S, partial [Thermoanaerobaculia bacterium]|nr:restriction endonuclease subunit S [Thermoanaerobaculia bacterium]